MNMGLPRAEIPVALLLFNLGVEAGQMLFVLLIVLLARAFRTLEMRWPRWVGSVPDMDVSDCKLLEILDIYMLKSRIYNTTIRWNVHILG